MEGVGPRGPSGSLARPLKEESSTFIPIYFQSFLDSEINLYISQRAREMSCLLSGHAVEWEQGESECVAVRSIKVSKVK